MDREPWKYKKGWYCSVSLTGNLLGYDYRLTHRSKQSCEIWWSISHNMHPQCGECSSFICSDKDVAKINEFIQYCNLGRIWKWEVNGACKKKKRCYILDSSEIKEDFFKFCKWEKIGIEKQKHCQMVCHLNELKQEYRYKAGGNILQKLALDHKCMK